MPSPMLTRRSALLVKVESAYATLPTFSGTTDALLMSGPQFTADIAILRRDVIQPSLSKLPHMAGRKLSKLRCTVEPNLNGQANLGISGNAPILGTLLRGCGMLQTAKSATWVSTVLPLSFESKAAATMTPAVTGAYASHPIAYTIECTTGGGSGVAVVKVTPHDLTLDTAQTSITLTNASSFAVGANGASITPSALSALVAGMKWVVILYPKGLLYTPASSSFESVGLGFFVDGSVHYMTGCYGNFSIKADAGKAVSFDFDFTGIWNAYADVAFPSITYTAGRPPVFQSAGLSVATYAPMVDSFTLDMGVQVSERPSANSADGLYGLMITDRAPKAGIDPEATASATHDFWAAYAAATVCPLFARMGAVAGSRMFFSMPGTQYAGLSYKDRNGIRAHDAAVELHQINGDDELQCFLY